MRTTEQQLRTIIREALLEQAQLRDDDMIITEMEEIMSLIEELFLETRVVAETGDFYKAGERKPVSGPEDVWVDDLRRAFKDRIFRVRKGDKGPPPKGERKSLSRVFMNMVRNVASLTSDLAATVATAAKELGTSAGQNLATSFGLNEIDETDPQESTEIIKAADQASDYVKTTLDYLDEILSRLRSPTLSEVYLKDIERIVQDLRLHFRSENETLLWGSRIAD